MKFIRLSRVRSALTGIKSSLDYQQIVPVAVLILTVIATIVLIKTTASPGDSTAQVEAYQEQLRSQVDTTTGEPRSGRDPGSQQQTSLDSAASSPTGAGQRVDQPASTAIGNNGDPSQTGISSSGCYIDYGIPGEQCVPVHATTNGTLTCSGIRTHGFPNGVIVSGTDRFNLDTNHDGTACGAGE